MRLFKIILPCLLLIVWMPTSARCENPLVEKFLESRRVVSTVYFDDHSYLIPEKYQEQLTSLIDVLRDEIARGRFIRAEGFAGDEGRDVYSFKLALQRAKSVVDFFDKQKSLPEIYLTGYGDLQANGSDSNTEWRVEIVSYENVIDVSMIRPRPNLNALPVDNSPISSRSLLNFKQGHMEALTKFDEPLVIDALAIEQALMEKLGDAPATPSGAVSQVDWNKPSGHAPIEMPGHGETSIP